MSEGASTSSREEFDERQNSTTRNTYLNASQSRISAHASLQHLAGHASGAGIHRYRSEADLHATPPADTNERSGLLAKPDGQRTEYQTMKPVRPRLVGANSYGYSTSARGGRSRRSSFARQTGRSFSTHPEPAGAEHVAEEATYHDDRVWYDQFTSTDWVYDGIQDALRAKRLKAAKGFAGRTIAFLDAAQGWLMSLLIGCVTAGFAYVIDVTEASVYDWKSGYCSDAWWQSRRDCCDGADVCDKWRRWPQLLGFSDSSSFRATYAIYVAWVVVLAALGCIVTLSTRTTISSAMSLSTLDENLGADRPHDHSSFRPKDTREHLNPITRYRVASQRPPVVYYPAAGSGVAEVRVILSGFVLHGYLGLKTLLTKTLALIPSVASGLSIGKEGPYVHIATCIGNVACRLSPKYRNNDSNRREMMSAAAAAGVAVAFGAPIAGVLFSLEEVSYYFPRKTLFRTFFCTIAAALSLKFLNPYGTHKIVLFEVRYLTDWRFFELGIFCVLGVLGGVLGALFIKASRVWAERFRSLKIIKHYPMLEVILVALVTGLVSFWNRYTRLPVAELMYELAAPCEAFSSADGGLCPTEEKIPHVIGDLLIAFVVKAVLTTVTFGIKIPAGIYVPSMVVGGFLGRIIGHAVQMFALTHPDFLGCPNDGNPESCVVPGIYALVAAGATMCGVTRLSVTLAVILFELTGSLAYVLPFSLAVLIAKWTADALEPLSIYDLLTDMNAYPYLDSKDRPLFTTDLGDIAPPPDPNRLIDISLSPLVPARQLRMKLGYMQMAGELDGGLPILRDNTLVGLIPGPTLEFLLDKLDEQDDRVLCYMDPHRENTSVQRGKGPFSAVIDNDDDDDEDPDEGDARSEDTGHAERTQLLDPPASLSDPTDFTAFIDPAPVALDICSPMDLVFECFVKLGLRYICVVREGKFVGLVHKKTFVRRRNGRVQVDLAVELEERKRIIRSTSDDTASPPLPNRPAPSCFTVFADRAPVVRTPSSRPEHSVFSAAAAAAPHAQALRSSTHFSTLRRYTLCPVWGLLVAEQPRVTTASSQKKRKLAPAAVPAADDSVPSHQPQQSRPDDHRTSNIAALDVHAVHPAHSRSSPSSSPHHPSDSQAPSPTSSNTTRNTSPPPRFLPPHLHDEVLPSKEYPPSGGGANHLSTTAVPAFPTGDSPDNGSADMSSSEHGSKGGEQGRNAGAEKPINRLGARAASPAKRTAADMEDASGQHRAADLPSATAPGSFGAAAQDANSPTDYDVAMSGMTPVPTSASSDTQETALQSNGPTSVTNTDADQPPPPYSASSDSSSQFPAAHKEPYSTERVDQQFTHVSAQMEKPIGEGDRGVVISQKWLNRVMSRTTEGLKSGAFPKDAREGVVGPVDNSDIIAEGGLDEPLLNDTEKCAFVPLKPGLAMNEDYRVVPHHAYDFIMGEYGYKSKYPIFRYAHDTTQGESAQQNFQYEIYPPTITIRKVSPNQPSDEQPKRARSTFEEQRVKKERGARGQRTEHDAVHLVSSRSERFQSFLARSKEAAGIPRSTKVKLWRLMNPANVAVDKPENTQPGVLSPPSSRDTSPSKVARSTDIKLVLDTADFDSMQVGTDLEFIDAKDETNNDKYNGKSTMETVALNTDQCIVLEEQVSGPGGGEFQSDSKKAIKLFAKKPNGTKPGSAPGSGRTSPAPGGIMTRGRARRDGRTRGTVGLTNLGNTCYMNSALQCIRSVEELAVFFVSNAYKKEINNDNPLGHHGAMANAYAGVLRGIYSKTAAGAFTPSEFKKRLGTLQPLFSGYGQQDSQEFLSFLVDALHEDLNRIKKKPYNENPDSDDKTVHDPQAIIELGDIYRKNHRARNDSVAMDLFSGFYKNTMECPVCDKISITFDPYSLLTVQLPIENTFTHTITFFPLRGKPVNHTLDVDKNSTIKTVKETIARKHPGVTADRLWMVEVYSHKIYKVFEDFITLAEANIVNNDYIFMYELDKAPTNLATPKKAVFYSSYSKPSSEDSIPSEGMYSPKAECIAVPIFNRVKNTIGNHSIAMHPLYITLTRDEAQDYETILKKTLIAVSNITSRPILTEFSGNAGSSLTSPSNAIRTDPSADASTTDDAAGISDHSSPSEDGYVNVSLGKPPASQDPKSETLLDAASPMSIDGEGNGIPAGFMDPGYYIDPALRLQLFDVNVAKSSENMHCASMQSFLENSVRLMYDRVKKSGRRSSIRSTSSEDSSTSTVSDDAVNGVDEESDGDDSDKPDITLGGPSSVSAMTVNDSDDEDALSSTPVLSTTNARSGRRRGNRGKKDKRGKRGGRITYGQKDRARYNQNRANVSTPASNRLAPEDGPYYVQIGEAIVLDWHNEAIDSLFNGDAEVEDDMRGHRLSTDDGRQVAFFHDPELVAKKQLRENRKKHGIGLEDCFVETGKREVLSEDNAWYCNRCKEMRRAAKTLEIWTIPDILVVHLKRFGGNRSFRDKIDVFVDYPITGLDMTDKIGLKEDGKEYIYDLFAVDNHYGGLGGGHYTAMAKNFYDGQWYDYNDSSCSKIGNEAKLQSAAAYLLFYRRRSDSPLGPQYLQDLVNEARSPTPTEAGNDDAEESESGEGRLGGPTISSLHGSSSASTGAGVAGTNNSLVRRPDAAGGRAVGAPAPADSSRIMRPTKTMNSNNSDVEDDFGEYVGPQDAPRSSQLHSFGSQDAPAWSFASLNQGYDEDNTTTPPPEGYDDDNTTTPPPETMFGDSRVSSHPDHNVDDDATSTTAEMDRDSAYGDSTDHGDLMDDSYSGAPREHHEFSAGRSSPVTGIAELPASGLFSTAPDHVTDAGMGGVNNDEDDDPPPVDIHVGLDDHAGVQ